MQYLDLEGIKYLMECAGITPAILSYKNDYTFNGTDLVLSDNSKLESFASTEVIKAISFKFENVTYTYFAIKAESTANNKLVSFMSGTGNLFHLTFGTGLTIHSVPTELKTLLESEQQYTLNYYCSKI